MSKGITEIRWHGRGGQGAKTASLLFADAAMSLGKYIQAFPEYGPERMGAPVQSFNRLADEPITVHCGVTDPSIVVVLDPTLLATVPVTAGLPDNGVIIVNSGKSPKEIRSELKLKGAKVFTVDASRIAQENIGRNIPNTPMLGALVKVSGILDFNKMLADTEKKLQKKFAHKPEVIEGNMKAIKAAHEEVKGE
ncbi:MAG: 2-oxoacid:acceptor oxidoreductase family protein [Candidatus Margulisbacteria bacterium]|nr:2-oxoacid:acceptor oxidoreductase family protein [Candidatus Margulisiibacteriota bacterium]MBU1021394.1 2-oxoacid:acceptor oxidoreductase family protein [Candidatus Margulisiibacteriota bacterium]MBU1729117.1 2-oxoacid:acceptor oxidoreductase family protein [Candidatus Margulisiibacteriota bacterium]MBU1954790.1 2-oxoacid:acceptor oxidoreductase family protein [Candidatus Margulisiibacteriota bacterium]